MKNLITAMLLFLCSSLILSSCTRDANEFYPRNKDKKNQGAGQKETKKVNIELPSKIPGTPDNKLTMKEYFAINSPTLKEEIKQQLGEKVYNRHYTVWVESDLHYGYNGEEIIFTDNCIKIPEYFSEDGTWRYVCFYYKDCNIQEGRYFFDGHEYKINDKNPFLMEPVR